jgi:hypothetical protein
VTTCLDVCGEKTCVSTDADMTAERAYPRSMGRCASMHPGLEAQNVHTYEQHKCMLQGHNVDTFMKLSPCAWHACERSSRCCDGHSGCTCASLPASRCVSLHGQMCGRLQGLHAWHAHMPVCVCVCVCSQAIQTDATRRLTLVHVCMCVRGTPVSAAGVSRWLCSRSVSHL